MQPSRFFVQFECLSRQKIDLRAIAPAEQSERNADDEPYAGQGKAHAHRRQYGAENEADETPDQGEKPA